MLTMPQLVGNYAKFVLGGANSNSRAPTPKYCYYVNNSKTWLVVKEEFLARADILFQGTGIQITCKGKNYLGSTLGMQLFKEDFVRDKVGMCLVRLIVYCSFQNMNHKPPFWP